MGVGTIHIWNMALGHVGTRTVASESENCEEARQCALYWDAARRQALRDFPYPWAQTRIALAAKALPAVWDGEWQYAYAYPSNCLKLHKISRPGSRQREAFKLIADPDGGASLILTNCADAVADYTVDIPSPAQWDDLFIYLLGRKLACLIAVPLLKNNGSKVNELEQLYRAAIPAAYEGGASEGKPQFEEDSWITSRGC